MWSNILSTKTAEQVAELLTEKGPQGDLLRDTAPVFTVIPDDVRLTIICSIQGRDKVTCVMENRHKLTRSDVDHVLRAAKIATGG